MATQGPLGGTGSGAGWTNPTNIASTNAVYATQSVPALNNSTDLSTSSLGFTVPAGATINGIQVDVVRHASATLSLDFADTIASGLPRVSISKTAGTRTGTSKTEGTQWGTTDATTTFGGAADLWGTTWTVTEINAAGFGAVISCENTNGAAARTASIDSILITVTYTPAAATNTAQMFMVF